MLDGSPFTSFISPQLQKFFMVEYFIFQNINRQFSLMGLDQIHKQNNDVMKGMVGATSSLSKVEESSSARWTLCIHEQASIVSEYEFEEIHINSLLEAKRHHEYSVAFQKRFITDVNCHEKAGKSRRYLLEDALKMEVFGIAHGGLSLPWYKVVHNSSFNLNKWHKKNSTRYKWLRDRAFHALDEQPSWV